MINHSATPEKKNRKARKFCELKGPPVCLRQRLTHLLDEGQRKRDVQFYESKEQKSSAISVATTQLGAWSWKTTTNELDHVQVKLQL